MRKEKGAGWVSRLPYRTPATNARTHATLDVCWFGFVRLELGLGWEERSVNCASDAGLWPVLQRRYQGTWVGTYTRLVQLAQACLLHFWHTRLPL